MSELMDACEQTSEEEADTWEVEEDRFEGSVADADEEQAFHLAETHRTKPVPQREMPQGQLHKREQSCMRLRAAVVAITLSVQGRRSRDNERQRQTPRQESRHSRTSIRTVTEHTERSSWDETAQTNAHISKTLPEVWISGSCIW